jgi:hypothetical protein
MILLQRAEFVILTYPMYISFVNIAAQPEWTILPFCAPTVTSKRSNARNIQPYATNSTRTGKNIGLIKELSSMTPKKSFAFGFRYMGRDLVDSLIQKLETKSPDDMEIQQTGLDLW